ncbi:hypothetical protein ACLEC1_02460 [Lonsdalea quercina]
MTTLQVGDVVPIKTAGPGQGKGWLKFRLVVSDLFNEKKEERPPDIGAGL